jgi:hypothetical protein
MHMNLSYIYMDAGDYEESIRIANETWERDPHYGEAMGNLFLTYLRAARPADAAKAMQFWAASTGRDVEATGEIGRLFIRHQQGETIDLPSGLLERAGFVLEDRSQIYAYFEDAENTLATLDQAVRERSGARNVLSMKVNPLYNFVKNSPRFIELMRSVGLDRSRF